MLGLIDLDLTDLFPIEDPQWHNIDDSMPFMKHTRYSNNNGTWNSKPVLVCLKNGKRYVAHCSKLDDFPVVWYLSGYTIELKDVVAWMYLPQSYNPRLYGGFIMESGEND